MTTVDVVFPDPNGPSKGKPTAVFDDEAVIAGQDVLWNIKSENPAVTKVKIIFKEGERFFPGRTPEDQQVQVFPKYDGGVSYHMVWGKAPHLLADSTPIAEGACVPCKYTIHGLDGANGDVVPEHDPNIIISYPHP